VTRAKTRRNKKLNKAKEITKAKPLSSDSTESCSVGLETEDGQSTIIT